MYASHYLRTSNICVILPIGDTAKMYSCSFAVNLRIQPTKPSDMEIFLSIPVILPVPPRNIGSRNVMRENRPYQFEIRISSTKHNVNVTTAQCFVSWAVSAPHTLKIKSIESFITYVSYNKIIFELTFDLPCTRLPWFRSIQASQRYR